MKYRLDKSGIEILGKEEFNPKHILECGQIFRFFVNNSGNYQVISLDHMAEIVETLDGYKIITKSPAYFVKFFNLDTNYTSIKEQISKLSPVINSAVNSASGLRILKQDLFEVIVSFIVSQNNNIKRIKLILNQLAARAGRDCGGYFAFPTVEEFDGLTEDFFRSIGAGYRASFLAGIKDAFLLLIKEDLNAMSDIALRQRLMEIKGVGPKVADCIMLFGFNRKKVFPVDVWMERVYYEYFGEKKLTRPAISKFLTDKFGENSGYIQQYLFYQKTVKG